jgi:cell division protein FtsB
LVATVKVLQQQKKKKLKTQVHMERSNIKKLNDEVKTQYLVENSHSSAALET